MSEIKRNTPSPQPSPARGEGVSIGERTRIARYFAPLASDAGSFHLTDDAAVLHPPAGASLVITTDSVIENVHVLAGATPQQFAQKLVRRNLSDLAAMGAAPWRYTLNLHTPHGLAEDWFAQFAAALAEEQSAFGMVLIGGDSTSAAAASIHATMTCFGLVDGAPLRRSGAKVGDDIYVSGTIGDAALGLRMLQQKEAVIPAQAGISVDRRDSGERGSRLRGNDDMDAFLVARYHRPEPRLALGAALRGMATAAMDISDGLLSDMAQLCAASGVGAMLTRAAIPLCPAAQQLLQQDAALWDIILRGGDDYELLFTAPASARGALAEQAASLALPLTCIGEITAANGIRFAGEADAVNPDGFEHA